MNTSKESTFYATPKQIKDWYNYMYNGNVWIRNFITLRDADPDKMQRTFYRVLRKHEILRSIFRMDAAGTIVRKVLAEDDPVFDVQFCKYASKSEFDEYSKTGSHGVQDNRLDTLSPLCAVVVYVGTDGSVAAKIMVHHIICNGSSFKKLMNSLIDFYVNETEGAGRNQYQFQDYAQFNFNRLRTKFLETFSFLQDQFNTANPLIVRNSKDFHLCTEASMAAVLSRETYHVSTIPPALRQCKTGVAVMWTYGIANYPAVRQKMTNNKLFLSTLVIASFASVLKDYSVPEQRFFGSLLDDCYNEYSLETIGDFTGDIFFDTHAVSSSMVHRV